MAINPQIHLTCHPPMMRLEHVGIAVDDLAAAQLVFGTLFGLQPYKSETVRTEGVRTHFMDAGSAKLELLEALGTDSPIAGFLARRGPGLHHLAFEVDDLDAAHQRLRKAGFRLLGEPKDGADGKRIFFVHPKDTAGVLVECCATARPPEVAVDHDQPTLGLGPSIPLGLRAALSRWFALVPDSGTGECLYWGSEGLPTEGSAAGDGATRRTVAIDPPLEWESADQSLIIRTTAVAGARADVLLPAAILETLPDPWGLLARIAAAHLLAN